MEPFAPAARNLLFVEKGRPFMGNDNIFQWEVWEAALGIFLFFRLLGLDGFWPSGAWGEFGFIFRGRPPGPEFNVLDSGLWACC